MARRKNVKRIDPRYFLHETVNRGEEELKEAEFQDTGFPEEDYEANVMAHTEWVSAAGEKPGLGSALGRDAILERVGQILEKEAGEGLAAELEEQDISIHQPPPDFLNQLQEFTELYVGRDIWQEVVSRLDLRM